MMAAADYKYTNNGREIVCAKLVKRSTADSLLEVCDNVVLGAKYIVYAEPIKLQGYHVPSDTLWERDMYEVVEGGWLPVEMLEIVNV